jgi:hypothetical protein
MVALSKGSVSHELVIEFRSMMCERNLRELQRKETFRKRWARLLSTGIVIAGCDTWNHDSIPNRTGTK